MSYIFHIHTHTRTPNHRTYAPAHVRVEKNFYWNKKKEIDYQEQFAHCLPRYVHN